MLQNKQREMSKPWYLDSACSRHITENKENFLSYRLPRQTFGKVGKTIIKNVYYVLGLNHNLISISQMCDNGNSVVFTIVDCTVTNFTSGKVILKGKRHKNVYKIDIIDCFGSELTCISALTNYSLCQHKKLGYERFSMINKLVSKDMVIGLPKGKVDESLLCDACAKDKYIRSLLTQKDCENHYASPTTVCGFE